MGTEVVLTYGEQRRELSEGYRLTTNNRMEPMGTIKGFEALKQNCKVTLHSDSQYVVEGIEKGWAKRWRGSGWMRNNRERAVNPDLWGGFSNCATLTRPSSGGCADIPVI